MIGILEFRRNVADAKQHAIELYQKVKAGQPQLTERLARSQAAIERSQKILSAERQD